MLVNLPEGKRGKILEHKVGEDGVVFYREAEAKDHDAAKYAMVLSLENATVADRLAELATALLRRCVTGWAGFVDAAGKPIPHSPAMVDVMLSAVPMPLPEYAGNTLRDDLYKLIQGNGGEPVASPLPESGSSSTSGSQRKRASIQKRVGKGTKD